jgi:cobalt/nickel transport system permease protein
MSGQSPPEWLCRPEGYSPEADRDGFLEKSILSFLSVLASLRNRAGEGVEARKSSVHPSLRLASSFLLILLVSLSDNGHFLAIAATWELILLALLDGARIAKVLRASLFAALFAAVIFLPSALWGNFPGVLRLAAKVLLSVAAAALVSATAGWTSISRGLAGLHVPELFILVLDLAIKYISLLGGLVLDLLYALKLRSVGRNRDKTASLSGVAGTVFLKSKEAAEEMYAAMECRGFSGSYRTAPRRAPAALDFLFLAANAAIIFFFFFFQGAR